MKNQEAPDRFSHYWGSPEMRLFCGKYHYTTLLDAITDVIAAFASAIRFLAFLPMECLESTMLCNSSTALHDQDLFFILY